MHTFSGTRQLQQVPGKVGQVGALTAIGASRWAGAVEALEKVGASVVPFEKLISVSRTATVLKAGTPT